MSFSFLQKELKETGDLKGNYLLLGRIVPLVNTLTATLRKLFPTEIAHTADLFVYQDDTFTIEAARNLKERHSTKPLSGRGFFIVAATRFTLEAQNALLKVIEEPGPKSHFFIITENAEQLLPTVSSRLVAYRPREEEKEAGEIKEIELFLKSVPGKRLLFLEKIINEKSEALSFLTALQMYLHKTSTRGEEKNRTLFLLGESRTLLFSPGVSTKHVLERLALLIPLTK